MLKQKTNITNATNQVREYRSGTDSFRISSLGGFGVKLLF
jgi:hypothetical protein